MAFLIRLNALLIALVLGSAFYLVHVQYQSRRLYTELDRAHNQTRQLQTEHEQLQVEKRAQATSARVQQMAADRLHMRPPHPGITVYVDLPVSAAPVDRTEPQGQP
jgi:cell division protein FtsL